VVASSVDKVGAAAPPVPTTWQQHAWGWGRRLGRQCSHVALFSLEGTHASCARTHGFALCAPAVQISLLAPTPLRWTLEAAAPLVGAGRAPGGSSVAGHLGLPPPRSFAVLPVLYQTRLVGLLYVDHGHQPLPMGTILRYLGESFDATDAPPPRSLPAALPLQAKPGPPRDKGRIAPPKTGRRGRRKLASGGNPGATRTRRLVEGSTPPLALPPLQQVEVVAQRPPIAVPLATGLVDPIEPELHLEAAAAPLPPQPPQPHPSGRTRRVSEPLRRGLWAGGLLVLVVFGGSALTHRRPAPLPAPPAVAPQPIRFVLEAGSTLEQVASQLEAQGLGQRRALLAAAADPDLLHRFKVDGDSIEGFLLPGAYLFDAGAAPTAILEAFLQHFAKTFRQLPGGSDLSEQAVYDRVILASFIEAENQAGDLEQARRFAGHLIDRLDADQSLGLRSTAAYAQQHDSPAYNTLSVRGLTPGPIGNPSPLALRAALDPLPG
jgi:hypothetical protein